MKKFFLFILLVAAIAATIISFKKVEVVEKTVISENQTDKAEFIYERSKQYFRTGYDKKGISDLNTIVDMFGSSSPYSEKALRELITKAKEDENKEKVSFYYEKLLKVFPKAKDAEEIKKYLDNERMQSLLKPNAEEEFVEYTVMPGDSLFALAKKYGTTVDLIKKMNYLSGDVIRVGQKLRINTAIFSVHIDKSDNVLVLSKNGKPFKTYIVATGKNNSTPIGEFTVINKMIEPDWTKPGVGIVQSDDEEYELGARWLGISITGYGIHGTNDEATIGGQVTSGCVRMKNADVIELYEIVPSGIEVVIVD